MHTQQPINAPLPGANAKKSLQPEPPAPLADDVARARDEVRRAMLRVANLRAGYAGHPVLQGPGFSLRAGECAALLGPNGSGKTTLLRALSGVLPVLRGRVELMGRPLTELRPRERARMWSNPPNGCAGALIRRKARRPICR